MSGLSFLRGLVTVICGAAAALLLLELAWELHDGKCDEECAASVASLLWMLLADAFLAAALIAAATAHAACRGEEPQPPEAGTALV